jgi:hypothetical protein
MGPIGGSTSTASQFTKHTLIGGGIAPNALSSPFRSHRRARASSRSCSSAGLGLGAREMEEEPAGGGGAGCIVVAGDRSSFVTGLIENRAKEVSPLNPRLTTPRIRPVRSSVSSRGFHFDRPALRAPPDPCLRRMAADRAEAIARLLKISPAAGLG